MYLARIAKFTASPVLSAIFRIKKHGKTPRITGPAIIMYNHISRIDGLFVSHLFCTKKIFFMAKKSIFEKPSHAFFSKLIGLYPASGIDFSLSLLKDNHIIAITPEGTRSTDIKPFHTGIIRIAQESGAPIYPVFIHHPFSFRTRMEVTFFPPITLEKPLTPPSKEELKTLAEALRQTYFIAK